MFLGIYYNFSVWFKLTDKSVSLNQTAGAGSYYALINADNYSLSAGFTASDARPSEAVKPALSE